MKLTIGENIRNFRKQNNITQESLAEALGVSCQSVSRWENGTTYPDIELIPSISKMLDVSVDKLFGIPQIEKEKQANLVFDKLRRECMKREYDASVIVDLIRDIRRNYIDSKDAWRPWVEGNNRAFSDPKVLPEVRLLAEERLVKHPMDVYVIQTLAYIEDEDKINDFLNKHTTSFDCSERALLFSRYSFKGDWERFNPERCYKLYTAFSNILNPHVMLSWGKNEEYRNTVDCFMEDFLSLIREDGNDNELDMWIEYRLRFQIKAASRLVKQERYDDAIKKIDSAYKLLEKTMRITDEIELPTSCKFLDGMVWTARETWHQQYNDPDNPYERNIIISNRMGDMSTCYCIYPSDYLNDLQGKRFDALKTYPEFQALCEKIKKLIVTKTNE